MFIVTMMFRIMMRVFLLRLYVSFEFRTINYISKPRNASYYILYTLAIHGIFFINNAASLS